MNRVAVKNEMIARRTTKVVVILQHRGVQRRERSFLTQPLGQGFAGDLQCQAPHEGNNHSIRRLPCISSRKAVVAAMWDLIRGSLNPHACQDLLLADAHF